MSHEHTVMVAFAFARLADGFPPGEAYRDLVVIGTDRRRAAIAVCVAGGTPLEEAERRMLAYDDIWPLLEDGEDAAAGDLLELHGYFDLEVALDEGQNATVSLLQQALAGAGSMPNGYAIGIGRLLRTGRLGEAFASLRSTGRDRWPENEAFWGLLAQAAASFDPPLTT
jgi:hypothetical protein